MVENLGYGDWRSLELTIKDAAKKAAREAGAGISASTVDAKIRQARFDRFLSRVFAGGESPEWMLKGGLSMLARVPRSRTTKDVDLGDHLTFRPIRSLPTGAGENQAGVATRRLVYACLDVEHDSQVDTLTVDVVVGPAPVGTPEYVEPAGRRSDRRQGLRDHERRLQRRQAQQPRQRPRRSRCTCPFTGRGPRRTAHRDRTKQAISRLEPFIHFPDAWHRTYPRTARGVPSPSIRFAAPGRASTRATRRAPCKPGN